MVFMPEDSDQVVLAKLGKELRPDYAVINIVQTEDQNLELDIKIMQHYKMSYSDKDYKVVIKWSKIKDEGIRKYQILVPHDTNIWTLVVSECYSEKYKVSYW